jgi:hypothetical protein
MNMGRLIKPVFGEALVRDGLAIARIRSASGRNYLHTNHGRGFGSKIRALDFVNRTMREGAIVRDWARV